jgi:hypothetical protein
MAQELAGWERAMRVNRAVPPAVAAVMVFLIAAYWSGGNSVFGFESAFWDLGLIPILAALIIGVFRLGGPRRRFLIGFELSGLLAVIAYGVSCSRPARWSIVSALLPFQTGFWLSPDMKKGWTDLNPWGILVDAVILVVLPLLMALTGAVIGSARISLRRAMIAVAVMAVFLGAATAYFRRVRYYDAMGTFHRSQVVSILSGSIGEDGEFHYSPTDLDQNLKPVTESQKRQDAWHEAMAEKYWHAARYPWIKVNKDTPPPE